MSVVEIYNQIAAQFSKTRNRSWVDFDLFKKVIRRKVEIVKHQLSVLDVGCGNGRLYSFFVETGLTPSLHYRGIDASVGMIEQAKKWYPECDFRVADMREVPCDDNSFDIVFAIASFNHMLTKEDQEKALSEIFRVLKPCGYVCMTNWNLWRLTLKEKSWWYYVFCRDVSLARLIRRGKDDDCLQRDAAGGRLCDHSMRVVLTRWNNHELPYYAFTLRELKRMVKQAGLSVETALYSKNGHKAHWWNGKNIILIARKKHLT